MGAFMLALLVVTLLFLILTPLVLHMPRSHKSLPVAVGPSVVLLFLLLPRGPFTGQGLPAMLIVMPSFQVLTPLALHRPHCLTGLFGASGRLTALLIFMQLRGSGTSQHLQAQSGTDVGAAAFNDWAVGTSRLATDCRPCCLAAIVMMS